MALVPRLSENEIGHGHNDDFTTMEVVVQLLGDCFAIGETEAIAFMLRVHKNGSTVVKICPASEARTSIEKGRAKARTAAIPLRISWRPHTPRSEPDQDDA